MSTKGDSHQLDDYTSFLMPIMVKEGRMHMWHSICSIHRSHVDTCPVCKTGFWAEIVYPEEKTSVGEHEP